MSYGDSRETDDGAVIESGLPAGDKVHYYARFNNYSIYKAQVDEVIYTDDKRNQTGKVEYNVSLISYKSNNIYRKLFNVPTLNALGGKNDYSETVYQPITTEYVRNSENDRAYAENTDGDFVTVMFLESNEQLPIIVGSWNHPRNQKSAKESDGHRMKGEYNGIEWEINKDGELTIKSLGGPRNNQGQLTNESNGGILIKLAKDGKIIIDTGSQPKITVDKNANEITNEASTVKVGSGAVEPMVLGTQWLVFTNAQIITKLNALIAAVGTLASDFNSHTHPYTWEDPAGSGNTSATSGPSSPSPPSPAAAASTAQLAKKGKVE